MNQQTELEISQRHLNATPKTIASIVWGNSQLHDIQGEVIENQGYRHVFVPYDAEIPPEVDILFIQGPYGSYVPFINKIAALPAAKRPVVLYWFEQNLMFFKPDFLLKMTAGWFSELACTGRSNTYQQLRKRIMPVFRGRGSRFASLGDILWMRDHQMLDVFGVSASYYAEYFRKQGIETALIPRGYHPSYGKMLGLERDIAVTWMGKIRTQRRKKLIYALRDELAARGLKMHIHDNECLPFIFGEERTAILNRSWFVLNVLAFSSDEISIRYFIAAANGAVVLTEPGKNRYPFDNGVHLVACKVEEMVEKVGYYISHPEEWQRISSQMFAKVSTEITMENSIRVLLNKAEPVIFEHSDKEAGNKNK